MVKKKTYGSEATKNDKEVTIRFILKEGDNRVDIWAYSSEDTEGVAPAELINGVATYP